MKSSKLIFFPILLLLNNLCFAQYYAVNDHDSFVNVRSEHGVNAAIIYKLPNETIVFAIEDEKSNTNWLYVNFYVKKGKKKNAGDYTPEIMKEFSLMSGYIYKAKLTAIEELPKLKYQQTKNGYTCFNDSVKIKVLFSEFKSLQHKLSFSKENNIILEKVDNKPMIGTDGDVPRDEVKEISVSVNNVAVNIPPAIYKNLFNPSFQNFAYADKKGSIYLVMYNSDAAGSYSCIFVFKNGKFVQRLVFEAEC